MPSSLRLTLAPIVLLVLAACGTADAGGSSDPVETTDVEIDVVVDMMSGVPNPSWTVDGTEASQLLDLINALPESGRAEGKAGQTLGFRGFVLRGSDLPGDGEVRVLGEAVVVAQGSGNGRLHTDEDLAVFSMLRTMSEEHLDENLVQAIPTEGLMGS